MSLILTLKLWWDPRTGKHFPLKLLFVLNLRWSNTNGTNGPNHKGKKKRKDKSAHKKFLRKMHPVSFSKHYVTTHSRTEVSLKYHSQNIYNKRCKDNTIGIRTNFVCCSYWALGGARQTVNFPIFFSGKINSRRRRFFLERVLF